MSVNPELFRKVGPALVGHIHSRWGALEHEQIVPCQAPIDGSGQLWLEATEAEIVAAGFKLWVHEPEATITDSEAAAVIPDFPHQEQE
jgi:hypothetical protein